MYNIQTMKIAIVPDNHLNKSTYNRIMDREFPNVPFRSADFMRSFEWSVDISIRDLHPDLFIIPGDVYDNFDPSNEIRGFFSRQLNKLKEAQIQVVILIGNHDVCRKHHALKDIQELDLKSVRIIEQPKILLLKKFGLKLLMFPYSLDIEQKKITLKESFNKFVEEVHEKDDGTPSLFFGHFGVKGGKINEYEEGDVLIETDTTTTPIRVKKAFVNQNPNDIDLDDLDRIGSEYVFLGDYHRYQILPTKKCLAMYPGSMEKSDFSEVDQKKGFIIYDSEIEPSKNMGCCTFVEYPNCRPMKELKGNFKQIKQQFSELDPSKYQEAIIKISFNGTSEELFAFSNGIESFKKEVRTALNPIHLYHVQSIEDDQQQKEANRIEKEILEKGHMEAEDVIAVVKEIITEQIEDDEERLQTIDLAIEIFKETQE